MAKTDKSGVSDEEYKKIRLLDCIHEIGKFMRHTFYQSEIILKELEESVDHLYCSFHHEISEDSLERVEIDISDIGKPIRFDLSPIENCPKCNKKGIHIGYAGFCDGGLKNIRRTHIQYKCISCIDENGSVFVWEERIEG